MVKKYFFLTTIIIASLNFTLSSSMMAQESSQGKHLFILAGQSNIAGVYPNKTFKPTLLKDFDESEIIILKDAASGHPISSWYKEWIIPEGYPPIEIGHIYDRLIMKIKQKIEGENIQTICFNWMQGESDARRSLGHYYEEALSGLYNQLCEDLGRDDIFFIIGRLNDFSMDNVHSPHWTMIRGIQEKVAEADPRFTWIDTDDLNNGTRKGQPVNDDLHMSMEGFLELGKRFAEASVAMIKKNR